MTDITRHHSHPVSVRFQAISEKGRRANNEDFLRVEEFTVQGMGIRIFALADGMGGHQGGEVASRMAVETFISYLRENSSLLLLEETLREAIKTGFFLANKSLRQLEGQRPDMDGLGTTLTVVVLAGDRYMIGHIGDTRVYLIAPEDIAALTQDHSASAESVRLGMMSENEAARSPYAHALVRYLGSEEHFVPDILPGQGYFQAREGTALLLCCDGIFQLVSDLELYEQVLHSADIRRAAHNLVAMAFTNGSKDNLSVLLVEFGKMRRAKPLLAPLRSPFKKSRKTIWIVAVLVIAAFLLCEFFLIRMLRESIAGENPSEAIRAEKKLPLKNENRDDPLPTGLKNLAPDRRQAAETKKADPAKIENEKKDAVKK